MTPRDAAAAAELFTRESYGRVLAFLATRWRDVALAEDALSDALALALERWPITGVPSNPEAWMLTVARRKLLDAARGQRVRQREDVQTAVRALADAAQDDAMASDVVPDERLRLMLVCAHPAIDAEIRPALILQLALGLSVKDMAPAFLLAPDTLNKRLVRAKTKIKASGMRFEEPAPEDMAPRLHALLEAIYAAYGLGREGTLIDGDARDALGREAVSLSGVVAALMPASAEALGLRALLLFCEARRGAQVSAEGAFVPLLEQDPRAWDGEALRAAYALLAEASSLRALGPFQIEAAIQGAHCYRARAGRVPWAEIAALYEALVQWQPTAGAVVGMAVARAHADDDPRRGLEALATLDPARIEGYAPYWVAMSFLREREGQRSDAARCLARALALTAHPRLRGYLSRRLEALRGPR